MSAAHFRPLAEIDRDADRAVAVVLDGVGLAAAHRDGEAVGFGHFAVAAARAGALRAREHLLSHLAKRSRGERETVALRHGGAIITAMHDEPVSKTRRKKEMHELQALGVALVGLADAQLAALELPEELAAAV